MKEELYDAHQEIKRADHLIFVSLKYTRTVDVIRNVIKRLISTYDHIIAALLCKLEDDGKIENVPASVIEKVDMLKKNYPEDMIINDNLEFYKFLRRILKAEFKRSMEYRRHVTMSALLPDGTTEDVKIDNIHEYFDNLKEFISYVEEHLILE